MHVKSTVKLERATGREVVTHRGRVWCQIYQICFETVQQRQQQPNDHPEIFVSHRPCAGVGLFFIEDNDASFFSLQLYAIKNPLSGTYNVQRSQISSMEF